MALLHVEVLTTAFRQADGRQLRAVDNVSFSLHRGEVLGLAGESGCGKSTLAMSLLRLLPSNATAAGRVLLEGTDLTTLDAEAMRQLRWRRLSLVPQNAMNALNPVINIGEQVAEPIRTHLGLSRWEALQRARELLRMVQMDPNQHQAYPHELSGGMKQRVAIAMALACDPDILIVDEATTGLDVLTQAHILGLLQELQVKLQLSLILISHDLSIILDVCHRVGIMYAGQLVELRTIAELRSVPGHPYSQGLLAAFPPLHGPRRRAVSIPGAVADPAAPPPGCRFHPRCPVAIAGCRQTVPPRQRSEGRWIACLRAMEGLMPVVTFAAAQTPLPVPPAPGSQVLLAAQGLCKEFPRYQGIFRAPGRVTAVSNLDLSVRDGEVFGLIGESGCGKSTTARLLLGLERPTSGVIHFGDRPVWSADRQPSAAEARAIRRQMAIVFQDPYESLSPHMTVSEIVAEPLQVHRQGFNRQEAGDRVVDSLAAAGLWPDSILARYPHQLSGGQRQRVAIARALVLDPRFIAADEPTSMLDPSVRAGILENLLKQRSERGLTMLFITHDLATARYVCDRVGVMYQGHLVEQGPTDEIIRHSAHPYTRALIAAVADLPGFLRDGSGIIRPGEASGAAAPAVGCAFAQRCPLATPLCHSTPPPWHDLGGGHGAACHYVGEAK